MLYKQPGPHPILVFLKRNPVLAIVPVCFVAGMAIEWVKINFRVGNVSFYNIWKKNTKKRELDSLKYQLQLAAESFQKR